MNSNEDDEIEIKAMRLELPSNVVLNHFSAIPVLIEFIKKVERESMDPNLAYEARKTLNLWDETRK